MNIRITVFRAWVCLCAAPLARGHRTRRKGHMGLINAIGIDPQTGEREGAADPRDDGSAQGY
jgi:gamma-glutamyltranspeptidase